MSHPSGEAQKRVYEQLALIRLSLDRRPERQEELVELARTLAKGGPYASTVERFARDHGYSRRDPEPGNYGPGQPRVHYEPDPWPDPDARPRH